MGLALATGEVSWVRWALSLYATLGQVPPSGLPRSLSTFPLALRGALAPAVRRVVDAINSKGGPSEEERESFNELVLLAGGP